MISEGITKDGEVIPLSRDLGLRGRVLRIYIIRSEPGPIKIGIAGNPRKRLATLRTASPYQLFLDYEATVIGNAKRLEERAHDALRRHRLCGEWFSISS